ncbi:unnamed protein product [Schistosoma curassoni]|uniref:Uncharacterized protein n=1 Tax=Schistosoma curassoni TaxID=6186 RepID=A0A183JFZ9_9TREM|nr:unnamed protein product [Schistosoma curassoni]
MKKNFHEFQEIYLWKFVLNATTMNQILFQTNQFLWDQLLQRDNEILHLTLNVMTMKNEFVIIYHYLNQIK